MAPHKHTADKKALRVFIADDHPIFREGLVTIIESDEQFTVCGCAANGKDALEYIAAEQPDVAILDISMPPPSGISIAQQIRERELRTLPIILTMYSEEEYLEAALEHGVTGYLLKESTLTEILDCIRAVISNAYYISKELQAVLVKKASGALHAKPREALATLTPTERQVLRLLAQNKTSTQIAADMFISYRTVQNHRTNISHKLSITGHNSLLLFAMEHQNEL